MRVVTTREQVRDALTGVRGVGLVPTMGFLHEGHLSLVRAARAECDVVVVSIFVNPTQFGEGEDLAAYPRDLERDLRMLRGAGADVVWTPDVADVYPPGFGTQVSVSGVSEVLEGAARPGHFSGVATVVSVLLGVVRPERTYLGAKDAQQVAVLRRLVADLALPGEIVVGETVREADGLAMSSRNTYLSPAQRAAAPALHRGLRAAVAAWEDGEVRAQRLRALVHTELARQDEGETEYVSVADPVTLAEIDRVDPARGALVSLAVRFGRARLIDNVVLDPRTGRGAAPPPR